MGLEDTLTIEDRELLDKTEWLYHKHRTKARIKTLLRLYFSEFRNRNLMDDEGNNIEAKSQIVPILLKDVAKLTGKQTIDELVETNKEEIKNHKRVLPQILDNYIVVFNNVKREGIIFASADLSNVNSYSNGRKSIPILPKYAGEIAEYILKKTNKASNEYDLQKIREVLYWEINKVKTIGHNPLPTEHYGRRNWKELKRFLEAKPQVKVNADNLQLMFFKELENLESFLSLTPRQEMHYRRLLKLPNLSKNPEDALYLAIRLRQKKDYKRFLKLATDGHDVKDAERIAKSPEEYETLMVKHS